MSNMMNVYLVVGKEGDKITHIQTAWFNPKDADDQAEASTLEVSKALGPDHNIEYEVLTMAVQDSTVLPYIAVYVEGGLADRVEVGIDKDILHEKMNKTLADRFDPDTDDARIFDRLGIEVCVYDSDRDDDDE